MGLQHAQHTVSGKPVLNDAWHTKNPLELTGTTKRVNDEDLANLQIRSPAASSQRQRPLVPPSHHLCSAPDPWFGFNLSKSSAKRSLREQLVIAA
jgi:hypothetical protein